MVVVYKDVVDREQMEGLYVEQQIDRGPKSKKQKNKILLGDYFTTSIDIPSWQHFHQK